VISAVLVKIVPEKLSSTWRVIDKLSIAPAASVAIVVVAVVAVLDENSGLAEKLIPVGIKSVTTTSVASMLH